MKTEGTNLLVQCLPSGAHLGGPWPPRWAPDGREVSHKVVVIDRFHCTSILPSIGGMSKILPPIQPLFLQQRSVRMCGNGWTGYILLKRMSTQERHTPQLADRMPIIYRSKPIHGTLTLFGRHSTSLWDKHIGATWHRNLSVNWIMIGTCLFSAKPLQGLVVTFCQRDPVENKFSKFGKYVHLGSCSKMHLKCRLQNIGNFVSASVCLPLFFVYGHRYITQHELCW